MRPQQLHGQARERRDERAASLHALGGQRPVRTMLARPAQIAKLGADHAAHHARPRRRDEDQAQRGGDVPRHVEPFRRVEGAPDLPNFGGSHKQTICSTTGSAGSSRDLTHTPWRSLRRPFDGGLIAGCRGTAGAPDRRPTLCPSPTSGWRRPSSPAVRQTIRRIPARSGPQCRKSRAASWSFE